MKHAAILYAYLFFFAGELLGQSPDYHVQVINHSSMVSPGKTIQLLKDSKGFLWMLSPTKVQRYDGKNLLSFSFNDRCINIQQDEKGTIWLASRQAIYRYQNDYTGFEKLPGYAADSSQYLAMESGPGKKIYLLTRNSILQWNDASQRFDRVPVTVSVTNPSFSFLKSAGRFIFYKKSETLLARYDVSSRTEESIAIRGSNYLFPVNEDTVWVRQEIGSSSLVSFKAKTVMPLVQSQFDGLFNSNRFFVTGSTRSLSFIALNDLGFCSYNPSTNRFSRINLLYNGLPLGGSPPVTNFYQEENGDIWFGNEAGLVHLSPGKSTIGLLRSNPAAGENWNNDIRNVAEDEQDNIWFATANGFCFYNKNTGAVKTWLPRFESEDYLNYPSVRSIGYSKGRIIIGQSEKGFWIFDPATNTFKRPLFENDSIKKVFLSSFNSNMLQLRNGNFLILSRRVWLMEKDNFKVRQIKFHGIEPLPRAAYEDKEGRIWLLGSEGIFCVDADFNPLYNFEDKIGGRWYNAITQIDRETFWVASKSLFEMKLMPGAKLKVSPLFPELKNSFFSHLYQDSLQNVWMFGDDGIYRYLSGKKIVEKFDRNDNAQAYNVSFSNSFRSRAGILYGASTNGINYFVPERLAEQNDSLRVELTNVTVNQDDSTFRLGKLLPQLKYFQNSLVFDFVAPYTYNGEKVQYRCRLEGTDNDWIYLGNDNSVRYTSIKPGSYSFLLAASLNGKDWYAGSTPFTFVISPPFWQTWWFRALAGALVLAGVFLFFSRRERMIKEKEARKTEMQRIKADNYQYQLEMERITNFFGDTIHQHEAIDDMLWDVAGNLIGKLGFEDCMIYLWNDDKTVLLQKAGYGIKGSMQIELDKNKYHVPKGKGIVGKAVESKQALLVNDTSADSNYFSADGSTRLSELCVPIIHNGEVTGAINTEHTEKGFYTARHLQILVTIASMLADKIDMIKAQQQARQKEIEVLKLNKDLSASQLTALRAQMNPHFLFNAMNSIQQFTLNGDMDNANLYISKFSTLLRKVLHSSKETFIQLDDEIEQLRLYLDIEKLRMGSNFNYEIKVIGEIETDACKIPGMLIQPFAENALKHGLALRDGEKRLTIEFELCDDDFLAVTITDNGIGRKRAAEIKDRQEKFLPHESKGIQLIRERLALLNGGAGENRLTISDLTDKGVPSGTRVCLHISLARHLP